MDSLINAAARALAAGNPLGALDRVALREDPPALALRGIAMAQLGDFARARALLRRAGRAFGPKEAIARARCIVAEAEVAFAARDLSWPEKALSAARDILVGHGDHVNAAHARYLAARRHLLIGRVGDAESLLSDDQATLPPALRAVHELLVAGIAIRRLQAAAAGTALARAAQAARIAGIPALIAEIDNATAMLASPAARQLVPGPERLLDLAGVEAVLASDALVIDACRLTVQQGSQQIPLARRPILFALLAALGEASPGDIARDRLVARAFGGREADESHRARLRVEIGRLRTLLGDLGDITATKDGFALVPRAGHVIVLARPVAEKHALVLAFLADGEAWSSSALALAAGISQRSLQRALESLAAEGKVQFLGHGRARRWLAAPLPGFTTSLLLPAPLPGD